MRSHSQDKIRHELKWLGLVIVSLCLFYVILFAGARVDISPQLEDAMRLDPPEPLQN